MSCDTLSYIIERVFEEDLWEENEYREAAPTFLQLMEEKECEGLGDALNLQGIIHFNKKEPLKAKAILSRADSILQIKNPESPAFVRTQLWLALSSLQDQRLESAKVHLDKAIRLSEKLGYDKGLLEAYINYGTSYLNYDNIEEAEQYLNLAQELNKKLNNRLWGGYIHLNQARLNRLNKAYEKAKIHLDSAEQNWIAIDYPKGLYYAYLVKARIAGELEQIDQRANYLKQALNAAKKDSLINPHNTYVGLGYYYLIDKKDKEKAKPYFEKAIESEEMMNYRQLNDLAIILLDIYIEQGDSENLKQLNDYIFDVYRSRDASNRQEAQKWQKKELELEKRIEENQRLALDKIEDEKAIQQRNTFLLGLTMLAIVFLVITFLQLRSNRQKNKLLEQIQAQNDSLNKANEVLNLQKEKIESQNETILKTQDQLIVQEKLASLGQLTAGIAHELKNPLNFVNNFGGVSKELVEELITFINKNRSKFEEKELEEILELLNDLQQNMHDIEANGARADRIINSMMEHTRGNQEEESRTETDIHSLLDENINLAYHSYRAIKSNFNVDIRKNYAENLPKIAIIPGNIGRVLLNIFNNACYAIHEKQKEESDFYPIIEISTFQAENEVVIQVKDNGPGIPKEVKEKIFHPFFTTKPTGEGNTGLGLSISYDIIVKEHYGQLDVISQEGQFTLFDIRLPIE
jgi:signal transduction histidine kinase